MRPRIDVIQTDIPQSYGIGQAARMLKMIEKHGWSPASVLPHGGNQMSLNQAIGLGLGMCEAYPGAFGAFAGYADDLKVIDGWMAAGDWPGMGFERQSALFALMEPVAA
jgi:L-alanine-DL-glutamate epimerase-like enolase superfamily enzyme